MALFAVLLVAPAACAQYQYPQGTATTFEEYQDYPQIRGQTQPLTEHELPSWMTLDGELRSRTEDQSAINLLPGQDKFYELERVRGGIEIRPTSWLTELFALLASLTSHSLSQFAENMARTEALNAEIAIISNDLSGRSPAPRSARGRAVPQPAEQRILQ